MSLLDQFFVYHPDPWKDQDWKARSGLPLEDVWFTAADGTKLFGWYVENRATAAMILWCHGNAGNIINRLENLRELYRLGLSVFLFDYRGYGRSQGRPSEEGLYQDSFGAHDYLTRTRMIRPERIVLFGRSLGAAVAGELAAQKPAAGPLAVRGRLQVDRSTSAALAAEADHSRRQRRHYSSRTRPAGLRGGGTAQILLCYRRRRPQQHLPGWRGRLFPPMGRIHPGGPPILGKTDSAPPAPIKNLLEIASAFDTVRASEPRVCSEERLDGGRSRRFDEQCGLRRPGW